MHSSTQNFTNKFFKYITVSFLIGTLIQVQAAQKIDCSPALQPIVIDGDAKEWLSNLTPVEDRNFELGLQRDADFLYICLRSDDPEFKHMFLATGLNIWLDSKGKKKRNFGIHYPIGISSGGRGKGKPDTLGGTTPTPEAKTAKQQELLDYLVNDLDILGPKKDDHKRIFLNEETGIQAKVLVTQNGFVMEVKMPLHENSIWEHSISLTSDTKMSIGLETPTPNRKKGKKRGGMSQSGMSRQGGGSRGGMGGGGTGGGGMGGGGMGGSGMGGQKGQQGGGHKGDRVKSIKVWLKVNFI